MKSLLCSLLVISGLQIANAASTDTVTSPVLVVEPALTVPVEQKVVEIHMTTINPAAFEVRKGRKAKEVPFYLRSGTCSGEFINNNGDILTAAHCVDGFEMWEVQTFDHRSYYATVVATSTTHDLALLHIDRRNTAFFELADNVVRGQTIFVLGSPLGITDTLSQGIVAHINGDLTYIDCSALPGNSGGPVYNTEQKLIGVLNAGFVVMFGTTHLNVVQGLDAVHFFLKKALEKK